jgi:hypothetical protein
VWQATGPTEKPWSFDGVNCALPSQAFIDRRANAYLLVAATSLHSPGLDSRVLRQGTVARAHTLQMAREGPEIAAKHLI